MRPFRRSWLIFITTTLIFNPVLAQSVAHWLDQAQVVAISQNPTDARIGPISHLPILNPDAQAQAAFVPTSQPAELRSGSKFGLDTPLHSALLRHRTLEPQWRIFGSAQISTSIIGGYTFADAQRRHRGPPPIRR